MGRGESKLKRHERYLRHKNKAIPGPIQPSVKPVSKAEFERYKKAAEEKKQKPDLIGQVTDNTNFNAWVKENMSNPEFKQYGRDNKMEAVKDLWFQKRTGEELKNVHEISREEAISTIVDNTNADTRQGWFVKADSKYKPRLMEQVLSNPGTLNAGLNLAYNNYLDSIAVSGEKPMSFTKWINTPMTMYRGDTGQKTIQGDIFLSFSPDKKIAQGFGSNITKIKIKPIDTWGDYMATGEQEFLVSIKKLKK